MLNSIERPECQALAILEICVLLSIPLPYNNNNNNTHRSAAHWLVVTVRIQEFSW